MIDWFIYSFSLWLQ